MWYKLAMEVDQTKKMAELAYRSWREKILNCFDFSMKWTDAITVNDMSPKFPSGRTKYVFHWVDFHVVGL